jgi:hypothetical protein
MDYALHAPHVPHLPPRVVAPLVAFVIGGGAAVGIVAISGGLDSSDQGSASTLIIQSSPSDQPAAPQVFGAQP